MRHRLKLFGSMLAVLAVVGALICLVPSAVLANDYKMGPVGIQGQVTPDAGFRVAETRTFSFDGDYTFVYWEFEKSSGIDYVISSLDEVNSDGTTTQYVVNADASPSTTKTPGTYLVEDSSSTTKITAYFRKSDTDATFRLSYSVTGGVKRYQDTGELYWQAIGSGWGATTKSVTVDIKLPVPDGAKVTAGDNVKAWAHGPLNGEVRIGNDGVVKMTVPRIDSGTFVEARVAFPQEWLSEAQTIQQDMLPTILAQEKQWSDEANAQRSRARILLLAADIGVTLAAALLVAFSVFAYFKWGKEYKTQFNAQYLREVPEGIHPAVAGAIWSWDRVDDKEFTATLMNLSVQKVISISPITYEKPSVFGTKNEEDYLLTVDRVKAAALTDPIDISLVDFLFAKISAGRDTLAFHEIKEYGKAHPQEFLDAMNDWKAEVKAVSAGRGYIETASKTVMVVLIIFAIMLVVIGVIASAALGAWYPGVIGAVGGIIAFLIGLKMPRRSREANELYAQYKALKNYLTDFSKLDEAPPMHIILWEKFLVMAVVFGISEQVIEQMKVVMPTMVTDTAFFPVYFWVIPHGSMGAPSEAFKGTVLSASQVATSMTSSSGGGGGGFSGGGGGGFGGGGGGAG